MKIIFIEMESTKKSQIHKVVWVVDVRKGRELTVMWYSEVDASGRGEYVKVRTEDSSDSTRHLPRLSCHHRLRHLLPTED